MIEVTWHERTEPLQIPCSQGMTATLLAIEAEQLIGIQLENPRLIRERDSIMLCRDEYVQDGERYELVNVGGSV